MTDKRVVIDYVRDMLDAVDKVTEFTSGLDFDSFVADVKTTYAVVRALEILGEAAKHLPDEFRQQHPALPWREMAAMRDKLTHDYFGVNLGVVWKTIQSDVPTLRPHLQALLDELSAT